MTRSGDRSASLVRVPFALAEGARSAELGSCREAVSNGHISTFIAGKGCVATSWGYPVGFRRAVSDRAVSSSLFACPINSPQPATAVRRAAAMLFPENCLIRIISSRFLRIRLSLIVSSCLRLYGDSQQL